MEERLQELEKEVAELRLYALNCTQALQTIASMLSSLADNESLYESEVNDLNKFIHENL